MPINPPVRGEQINHSHPLASGLVGYWTMLEGTGDVLWDYSGHGFHGTRNGTGTVWVPGKNGWAQNFNGTDDHVKCGDLAVVSSKVFTYSVLMRSTQSAASKNVMSEGYSGGNTPMVTAQHNSGKLKVFMRDDDNSARTLSSGTKVINDGNWHLLCVGADGTDVHAYVDGIEDQPSGVVPPGVITLDKLTLGALERASVSGHAACDIAYSGAWSRLLSLSEMALLYRDPWALFDRPRAVVFVPPVGGITLPVLDEGMLVGGLQPLSGGLG